MKKFQIIKKIFKLKNEINDLLIQSSIIKNNSFNNKKTNIKVKSNTSKTNF